MHEYYGPSAKTYGQPQDKYFTLFPALERALPSAENRSTLLDLGCGTGDFYEFAQQKGYEYLGIDVSSDMLDQARAQFPKAQFLQGDATQPLPVPKKFEVIVCNMLLPALAKKEDF